MGSHGTTGKTPQSLTFVIRQNGMCPYLRFLDQDVKIPFMSQMPRGQLGVGTASPEDIHPSSPLDRPTGILVYNKTGECVQPMISP